jgi:hypothetical protein
MPYRYRLIDQSGNDLGPFASRRETWVIGERLSRGNGGELEVVNFVQADDGDGFHGYVVVTPL